MARVHQLTSHLPFKNKQHQLPLKSPVKTSGKGWLVHTAPLNQSQMSPITISLFSSLQTFLQSLILHFFSPHIPFPVWDCVDGWSSAVVIWHSCRLSVGLSVFFSPPQAFSPFPFLSLDSAFCQAGTDLYWPSTVFTIIQGEKLDPHGRCRQRSVSSRTTSKWSACPFDVMSILKYMPQPACLTKSSRPLSVYFSMSHVPLVTALWREQSCDCQHTILSLSMLEPGTEWTLIYFSTSVPRENTLFTEMLNNTGSPFLLTAL